MDDFVLALERLIAGPAKKSRVLSPRERAVVALWPEPERVRA
jgi:ATP-dependent Zn protease